MSTPSKMPPSEIDPPDRATPGAGKLEDHDLDRLEVQPALAAAPGSGDPAAARYSATASALARSSRGRGPSSGRRAVRRTSPLAALARARAPGAAPGAVGPQFRCPDRHRDRGRLHGCDRVLRCGRGLGATGGPTVATASGFIRIRGRRCRWPRADRSRARRSRAPITLRLRPSASKRRPRSRR